MKSIGRIKLSKFSFHSGPIASGCLFFRMTKAGEQICLMCLARVSWGLINRYLLRIYCMSVLDQVLCTNYFNLVLRSTVI